MIEKQSIINLSHYGIKSFALVVFGDSEATSLGEEEDTAFCLYLNCILIIYGLTVSEK